MSRLGKGGVAAIAAAVTAAVLAQGATAVVSLKADYQFHNNRASSVPGAPDLVDLGGGNAFATESVGGCATRVLTFPQGNGLQGDTSSVVPSSLETIVLDFRFADVSSYRRLIAGANGPLADTGLYVHNGKLDWYDASEAVPDNEGAPAIAANDHVEVSLIQKVHPMGMDQLIGFVNGVQQFDYRSMFRVGLQPILFQDEANEESAGAVSRVRIYDNGVTPAEVGDIYNASVLGSPSSCPAASASAAGKPKARRGPGGAIVVDTGVTAGCPDTAIDCTGTASVNGAAAKKSKGSNIDSSSFTVLSGQSQAVTVTLTKKGKKLLRKNGKLKVTTTVSATGPNGKPVSAGTAGKIKPPKAKKK
jgi:hypothetical protein